MPGQQISDLDRQKIKPKYFCSECQLFMVDPMQTTCGHLFCSSCIQLILSHDHPVCPKDGTLLKENEIFPDGYTKRELMAIPLHCSTKECEWVSVAKDLQAHINSCNHIMIKCVHPQCTTEVKRGLLAKHLENDCLYRSVQCEYCKDTLAFASMEKHIQEICLAAPVTCEHCGLADISRKEMKKHEAECDEIEVECDFKQIGCDHTKVTKRKELRVHYTEASRIHVKLLLQFVIVIHSEMQNLIPKLSNFVSKTEFENQFKKLNEQLSSEIRSIEDKLSTVTNALTGLIRKVERLEAGGEENSSTGRAGKDDVKRLEAMTETMGEAIERLEAKNCLLENEHRQMNELIERINSKVERMDQSITVMTAKFSDQEPIQQSQQKISYNGVLLWRIDQFQRKRQDAISGKKTTLYSPHFYSGQFGYKMCLKIYMNGDGFGKGSHLSLFFVVMKGEYDSLLTWPFQKKITMMLMDQGSGDHMIDAFHSDPHSSSFQRPKSDMNIASGSPLFMPIDNLNNRAYIKDDIMFIKVIVD